MMQCPSPIFLTDKKIHVPCGKCEFCFERIRNDWSFRLNVELQYCKSAWFVTLTYNNENVPVGDNCYSLDKKDIQEFMKRLRYYHYKYGKRIRFNWKTKYFIAGEYGGQTKRPHYHALLFNFNKPSMHKLDDAWKKGFTDVGYVQPASIHYVTKYFLTRKLDNYEGRIEPFTLSSKGLGKKYLDNAWYNKRNLDPLVRCGKSKIVMPRYYKDKVFSIKDREEIQKKIIEYSDEKIKKLEKKYEEKGLSYHAIRLSQIESKREKLKKIQTKKEKL